MHRYSGEKQIVFGETVSGRPESLEGVESIVGMFINSLPVCVYVDEKQPLREFMQKLNQSSVQRNEYSYMSLAEIQQLSAVKNGTSLFDTLIVFESFPEEDVEEGEEEHQLGIESDTSDETTNYALTLNVMPDKQL